MDERNNFEVLSSTDEIQYCVGVPKIEPLRQRIIIEDHVHRLAFASSCELEENPAYTFLQKCLNKLTVVMISSQTITVATMNNGKVEIKIFEKEKPVNTGEKYH